MQQGASGHRGQGSKALQVAVNSGRVMVVQFWLQNEANPNWDGRGGTLFHSAAQDDNESMAKLLMEKGAAGVIKLMSPLYFLA